MRLKRASWPADCAATLAVVLLLSACTQSSTPVATTSPAAATASPSTASPTASLTASPSPSAGSCAAAAAYGLLIVANEVELVSPAGCVKAAATMAPSSLQACAPDLRVTPVPRVSASNDKVYFLDGDTQIKSLTPDGTVADVTTVPGSATTISYFSVSPDDSRIAVVVEDMAQATTIAERLYVEDLIGGGRHVDLYSTTLSKNLGQAAMRPLGWHQGQLLLMLVAACINQPVPRPWTVQVIDASTGKRVLTLDGNSCYFRFNASPAGVACDDVLKDRIVAYSWTGAVQFTVDTHAFGPAVQQLTPVAIESPGGRSVALSFDPFLSGIDPATAASQRDGSGVVLVQGHSACLWIDDATMLAPDAVIAYPSGAVTALDAPGECAGRFPGGL